METVLRAEVLREIVIPNYPDKIRIANARRVVNFVQSGRGRKDIPDKYLKNPDRYQFVKGVLVDLTTGQKVVGNPKLAGTPRDWIINFQDIWNGGMQGAARNNMAIKLKDLLRPYIIPVVPLSTDDYPVRLEIIIADTGFKVDASNRGVIYFKVIEDLLVTEGKIIDDSVAYINDTGRLKCVLIEDPNQRKMIIRILSSNHYFN